MTIQRFEPGPRMSQYVVHGDTVYTAGQVAKGAPVTISAKKDLQFQ
jgi:enamine deaminase RidA (YjgF/YER057c/UK114 family)